MGIIKNIKTGWIVHIFAFLHAAVALGCRFAGLEDELLLTILTMTMALIICLKRGLSIEFTASSIIVANIIGYLIGTFGAKLFDLFLESQYAIHALSTFITTEILGWSIVALTKIFRTKKDSNQVTDSSYISWIILAMCGVFVFRLGILFLFSNEVFAGNLIGASAGILSNSFSLIILICLNILYIRQIKYIKIGENPRLRPILLVAFILTAALIESLLARIDLPLAGDSASKPDFPTLFTASLIAEIVVYCLVYMLNYALSARSEMHREREKANRAEYSYVKLKQQVNPHFLFNSLNILDCLICEENTEAASAYTHKLAGIYRYMLKSDDEMVVPLRDELIFVGLYTDLLKERFPKGFAVETSVPEETLSRYVLPCSIQLLLENATKHNAVSEEEPLIIRIETDGNSIRVTNNRVPKVTKSPSTGLGLKYIKQTYLDISGKKVEIDENEKTYSVTLPLI